MPKTAIIQEGDPVLRKIAKPVAKKEFGSAQLKKLISRMSTALKKEEYGVALAAPQIGAPVRLFIVSAKVLARETGEDPETKDDLVFANPEIIRLSRRKEELHEGCLSVEGVYGWLKRHEKATVKAYDMHGKPFTYHGSGLMAEIFQHEIDHLDGILFIDKVDRFDERKK